MDAHRGAVVYLPSIEDVREAYEIREALECMAIAKAMPHVTARLVGELEDVVLRMDEATDEEVWFGLNREFNYNQYAASKQPHLRSILMNVRNSASGYMYVFVSEAHRSGRSRVDHLRMLRALEKSDVEAAQGVIRRHLGATLESLLSSGPATKAGPTASPR